MIKIAHEAPNSIFRMVKGRTDYLYALVHLFEENRTYFDNFKKAVKEYREVILDNSIFELGEAFDPVKYEYWIQELKPTWYIIPDVLEDAQQTVAKAREWFENRSEKTVGKTIGVVQGKTYQEIVWCYRELDKLGVDMIAISFDYSLYEDMFPHPSKWVSWMMGRVELLGRLERDNVVNRSKPHHLLGCALPQEGLFYRGGVYPWIYSMDTSNPVLHGMQYIEYISGQGLWYKEKVKMFELIDDNIDNAAKRIIKDNILQFRYFWNGY